MVLNILLALFCYLLIDPMQSASASSAAPGDFAKRNYNTINSIYNVTVYPNK